MTAGRLPRGVGYDYAGVVESVGEGVARLKPGDAVVGIVNPVDSRNAAMAERVCATEALATAKPPSLSFTDGASLPGAGITAVQALREARLAAGQRVLVVGAAGGVGSFAVQLARDAGAHVTAVASTAGQAFLATLSPERAIDYQREDWKALPRALRHRVRRLRHLDLSRVPAPPRARRRLRAHAARRGAVLLVLVAQAHGARALRAGHGKRPTSPTSRRSCAWRPRGASSPW